MGQTPLLIETSFADAIAIIAASDELPEQIRRHWSTSLRQIAKALGNGLMVGLLALCPIRLKNFADLEIGHTFKEVDGSWWITLPGHITKSRRPDERRVPALLNRYI